MIQVPKKGQYIRFKYFRTKIKSLFFIYIDFESILVAESNGKQNPDESYTNKYRKYIAYRYCYKLSCIDYKISKHFKSYLDKDCLRF